MTRHHDRRIHDAGPRMDAREGVPAEITRPRHDGVGRCTEGRDLRDAHELAGSPPRTAERPEHLTPLSVDAVEVGCLIVRHEQDRIVQHVKPPRRAEQRVFEERAELNMARVQLVVAELRFGSA